MHLDRLSAALGPTEVANAAPPRDPRPRLRHARGRAGRAVLLRAGLDGRRARPRGRGGRRRRGRARRRASGRRAPCRSWSCRASARRCLLAANEFFGAAVARARRRSGHRHERQDDDGVSAARRSSRRPAAGPALLTNIERRVGGTHAAHRAEHAGGDRPAAPLPRDARRGRSVLRDGGDVDRGREGTARRHALRRARLHEPDPGSPRLPRDDGASTSPRSARSSSRRSALSSTSATSGASGSPPSCRTARTFTPDDDLGDFDLKLRGRFNRANALGAIWAARELGIGEDAIRARDRGARRACPAGSSRSTRASRSTVIVDYAHTPDSLENVLRAARGLGDGG